MLVLTSRQNAPTEFLFPTKTAADKPAAAAAVISSNCIRQSKKGGRMCVVQKQVTAHTSGDHKE